MRYLLIILLFTGCSANWHFEKMNKKDPDFFAKQVRTVVKASVVYIGDSTETDLTRIVTIPNLTIEAPKRGFDRRIEKKSDRETIKREVIERKRLKIVNDTLKTFSKAQSVELKKLRVELALLRAEKTKEKTENFWKALRELPSNLFNLLMVILIIALIYFISKIVRGFKSK